jgi:hypothetical protein
MVNAVALSGHSFERVSRNVLPCAFPYQADFADLAGRIAKLPP